MRGIRLIVLVAFIAALSACTTTNTKRIDGMKADAKIGAGKSVVILEADVELSELTASGLEETRVDWTKAAEKFISDGLHQEIAGRGAQIKPVVKIEDEAIADQVKQLELLSQTVGYSIVIFQISPYGKLPTKRKGFDWTIGPNAKVLRDAYGADYALITYVRDSYSTGGRKALAIFGMLAGAATGVGANVSLGQRIGYTTLIDLSTGKVVWCNFMASGAGDLREEKGAKSVLKTLLSGLPL
jgi:hypothetical protein